MPKKGAKLGARFSACEDMMLSAARIDVEGGGEWQVAAACRGGVDDGQDAARPSVKMICTPSSGTKHLHHLHTTRLSASRPRIPQTVRRPCPPFLLSSLSATVAAVFTSRPQPLVGLSSPSAPGSCPSTLQHPAVRLLAAGYIARPRQTSPSQCPRLWPSLCPLARPALAEPAPEERPESPSRPHYTGGCTRTARRPCD